MTLKATSRQIYIKVASAAWLETGTNAGGDIVLVSFSLSLSLSLSLSFSLSFFSIFFIFSAFSMAESANFHRDRRLR